MQNQVMTLQIKSSIASTIILLGLLSSSYATPEWAVPSYSEAMLDRVLLKNVETLTLRHGHFTTGRRSDPIPQITCVGGSARCAHIPEVIQCENKGSNGTDIQWECKADMGRRYSFGEINVVCEGYEHANDPYIMEGSCGLEFTLNRGYKGVMNRQSPLASFFNLFLLIFAISTCCSPRHRRPSGGDFLMGVG